MTKMTNKNKQRAPRKAKKMQLRRSGTPGESPEAKAHLVNYVKLLTNPCTGPLVHGLGSTEGGAVTRFETDFLIGTGVSETAGALIITPGAINGSASNNGIGYLKSSAVADTSALTFDGLAGGTYIPGYTYLQANASSYRCVAACLQIYWPGTELNRAGVVSVAQGTFGLVQTGVTTLTPSIIRSISPVVERMPTNFLEAKWAPNYADGLFRNPTSTSPPEDGHSSLIATFSGVPASQGVRIRIVCVYEWRPKVLGLVLGSNTGTSSATSIQHVRQVLDKKDANWWHKAGQAAMEFYSGVTVAYAGLRGSSFPQNRLEL